MLRAIASALLSAALLAGPAGAEQPCWKRLANDWYDGRIDGSYDASCYRDALVALPEDGVYGLAAGRAELERGLRVALAREGGGEAGRAGASTAGPYRAPLLPILLAVAGIVAFGGASAWALERRRY